MALVAKAGEKKVCPVCGAKLQKVVSNKNKVFIKCSQNGMLEEGKPTTCEFVIDLQPKVLEKETIDIAEVTKLLNGEKVQKKAGELFISDTPKVIDGKKYYVQFEFYKAIVEDF